MNNEQKNNYQHYGVCDIHQHWLCKGSLEQGVQIYKNIMEYFNYERIVLLGSPHSTKGDNPAKNLKVLYSKSVMNAANPDCKVYAFGGLMHYYDDRDTADGYLRQIQRMDAIGFDGIKAMDGKPALRKKLGKRLDDSIFDKFYKYAEEHAIPIVYHVGDPESNWDRTKVSKEALERGWFYDETYPSLNQLREEIEGILTKFPRLRLTLAHFYFMGDDLEGTIQFFEKWKNVSFDLTPGGEMFVAFSKRIEDWREFFTKYADRIYYGTDTYNTFYSENLEDYEERGTIGVRANQVRRMLEWEKPFEDKYKGQLVPLHLDDSTLQKIYHDNCVTQFGEPRDVSGELAAMYASDMLEKFEHGFVTAGDKEKDRAEIEDLHKIYTYYLQGVVDGVYR